MKRRRTGTVRGKPYYRAKTVRGKVVGPTRRGKPIKGAKVIKGNETSTKTRAASKKFFKGVKNTMKGRGKKKK